MPRAALTFENGTRFGNWTVIGSGQKPGKRAAGRHTTSLCRCSCGITRFVKNTVLSKGRSQSCGHVSQFERSKSPRTKLATGMAARNAALYHIKHGAKLRGVFLSLTDETVLRLMDEPCYWCGRMKVNVSSQKDYNGEFRYNGIDRLDNSKGYVPENVVACCGPCNKTKNILGREEFIDYCVMIAVRHGGASLLRKAG